MKLGDDTSGSGKSNKLAALTGMGDRATANTGTLYPGRDTPTNSYAGARKGRPAKPYDPTEDDPLDHSSSQSGKENYIIAPSIQVRPEFSSLTRTHDQTQPLTCIVVIELPGKGNTRTTPGQVPAAYAPSPVPQKQQLPPQRLQHQSSSDQLYRDQSAPPNNGYSQHDSYTASPRNSHPSLNGNNYSSQSESSPFAAITEDLRTRIIDWKGHPLSDLGPLQMYDLLSVRRDSLVREFYVYLFREALICVVEEKKRSLGRLLSNASGLTDSSSINGGFTNSNAGGQSKGVLRLKGRIYVRHIKHVTASSAAGEMSLTIDMEDELASFILIYKERSSMEAWKNTIQGLVNSFQREGGAPPPTTSQNGNGNGNGYGEDAGLEEFGGSSKAMRMLSGSTGTTVSTVDSLLDRGPSSRSTMSSTTSHGSGYSGYAGSQGQGQRPTQMMGHHKLTGIGEDDEMSAYSGSQPLVTPHLSAGPSNSLPPLPHPPMDLILVVSIPPPSAAPSTAQLKVRVIKNMMEFILASVGPKDRVSLVTFEVGVAGRVRKTPFLNVGNGTKGRERLQGFVEGVLYRAQGSSLPDEVDEFLVRVSKEEKTDVVTAVNHGEHCLVSMTGRTKYKEQVLTWSSSARLAIPYRLCC